MINSNYQMDCILYRIFKIILSKFLKSIVLKKHGENIDNPSIKVFVNKIGNRITFEIEYRYSLEF